MILPPIALIWLAIGIGATAAAHTAYWRVVLGQGPERRPKRLDPDDPRGPEYRAGGIASPYRRRQYDPHYRAPSRSLGGGRGH